MSASTESTSSTKAVGDRLEETIVERRGWEHISDGGDPAVRGETEWFDALASDGTPIEIKGAVVEKSHGANRTAPGEWWIQRSNHRRLRDHRGLYELVVYREDVDTDELEIVASCRIPARVLDSFINSWFGTTGSFTQGEATKVPHPRVLGSLDGVADDLQEGSA